MPNRIEREIEEILTKLDEFVPDEPRSQRLRRRAGSAAGGMRGRFRGLTRGISGGHVVLGAAILLVVAMVLRGSYPEIARWLTYGGLAVIFVAIFLSIRPVRRKRQQYWRGEPIEFTRRHSPLTRARIWWRRNRKR